MAPRDSAAGRPGAGKSLTNPNSMMPRIGLTLEKRGSKSRLIADLDPDEWDFPEAEMDAVGDVQSLCGPN